MGLVPGAGMEQEMSTMGLVAGLQPALLFAHGLGQSARELQAGEQGKRALSLKGLSDGLFNWCQ